MDAWLRQEAFEEWCLLQRCPRTFFACTSSMSFMFDGMVLVFLVSDLFELNLFDKTKEYDLFRFTCSLLFVHMNSCTFKKLSLTPGSLVLCLFHITLWTSKSY